MILSPFKFIKACFMASSMFEGCRWSVLLRVRGFHWCLLQSFVVFFWFLIPCWSVSSFFVYQKWDTELFSYCYRIISVPFISAFVLCARGVIVKFIDTYDGVIVWPSYCKIPIFYSSNYFLPFILFSLILFWTLLFIVVVFMI
jgi:hypothetical protein